MHLHTLPLRLLLPCFPLPPSSSKSILTPRVVPLALRITFPDASTLRLTLRRGWFRTASKFSLRMGAPFTRSSQRAKVPIAFGDVGGFWVLFPGCLNLLAGQRGKLRLQRKVQACDKAPKRL